MQGHNGESREERLAEFLLVNPTALVYALPEGSALHIQMKWQLCWVKILFCASVKIWNVAHLTSIQLFLINLKGTYNGII